jgi:hypothetical protein
VPSASKVAIMLQEGGKERADMHKSSSYGMQGLLSQGLLFLQYPQMLWPVPGHLLARETKNGEVQYGERQMMHGWTSMNDDNEI